VHRPPPGAQRDIAASRDITERSACGIVTGLTVASYVLKGKDSRRDRYQIQAHLRCRTCQPGTPSPAKS
jgi:hypothetical protein